MAGSKQAARPHRSGAFSDVFFAPAEANRRCGYDRYGYNAPDFSGRYRYYREGGLRRDWTFLSPSLDHRRRYRPARSLSITRSSGDTPDAISIVLKRSRPIVIVFKNCRIEAPRASLGTGGGVPRQIRDGAIAQSGRRGVHRRPEQSTR